MHAEVERNAWQQQQMHRGSVRISSKPQPTTAGRSSSFQRHWQQLGAVTDCRSPHVVAVATRPHHHLHHRLAPGQLLLLVPLLLLYSPARWLGYCNSLTKHTA
eukprot:GHRQ01026210.1.p3 GENE.GHRQ01026210.1~~GHRQ01026210.1.p3  ORF type:complete len:103 (+),score=13.81 GHRQ01026210.1:218-526(+)